MYHLPACCCASDVIVVIELEQRAGNSVPEVGGVRLVAAQPGLHDQGRKSSVRRFVILTWDLLGKEMSPRNALTGHVFDQTVENPETTV